MLVVDDDPEVRQIVRRGLEREGFAVSEAGDGRSALASTGGAPVDVAVLDLDLPDMSGLDVLAQLRESDPTVHVIMLTGAASESDRVLGLDSGADDYMVKPFSIRELTARVSATQRRRSASTPRTIESGRLRIDTVAREAVLGTEPMDLTHREFELLAHLAAHPGRTFTREELLQTVWASSADWQSTATVTEHVRRLRNKIELDPDKPMCIVTVRGSGYRFDPDRDRQEAASPQTGTWALGATEGATVILVGASIAYASPGALELVGATDASAVVGREVDEFVAPRSVAALAARREVLEQGRWPRPERMTIVRLDGEEIPVEMSSMPVMWQGQHATQATMWELDSRRSDLQELVTGVRTDVADAVVITDSQLRIQSFNAAAEELYGWAEQEVIGRPSLEIVPWVHDDALARTARESLQSDGRWHGEVVQLHRDGTPVTVHTSVTLLHDGAGQPAGTVSVNRAAKDQAGSDVAVRSTAASVHDMEMRRAVERGEFVVHYQPVVRLDTSRWDGAEALVRWQHPERGLLAPNAFIDAAEQSGAIVDIGQFVLEEACRQWSAWRAAGHDLRIAVNLSGRQLAEPDLPRRIGSAMEEAAMPPGQLWLEVTETALVHDLDEATAVLRRLDDLGARVSIDDFGTGWASLAYLRQFPIHALKLDRVFVQGLGRNAADAAIVSSVLRLARELQLSTIAEGIETAAQLAHLLQLGCVLGQGYLFGRPVPAETLGLQGP